MRCQVEHDQNHPFQHIKPHPQPWQHLHVRHIFLIRQERLQMTAHDPSQEERFPARQQWLRLYKKLLWENTGHTEAKQRNLPYRRRRTHLDDKSAIIIMYNMKWYKYLEVFGLHEDE
jgi:hypothetical protein